MAAKLLFIPYETDTVRQAIHQVWQQLDLPQTFLALTVDDAAIWLLAALELIPVAKQSLFAIVLWLLWNDRNGVLFGSEPMSAERILFCPKNYDAEYHQINALHHRSVSLSDHG